MTIQLFDTPDPADTAAKITLLKSQGVEAVILYINPLWTRDTKTAKLQQIKTILAAGVKVLFVCEGWGGSNNFAHGDINATCGSRDGEVVGRYLDALGAPDLVAVFAAIDNDVTPAQYLNFCKPYFIAFRKALPAKYRLGAYGCGFLLAQLTAAKLIDLRWLSNATGWNGSRAARINGAYDILQGPETRLDGLDIDPDSINATPTSVVDVGFWKPDPPPAPSIMDINSDVAGA